MVYNLVQHYTHCLVKMKFTYIIYIYIYNIYIFNDDEQSNKNIDESKFALVEG
jgi:hypothetical protein